MIDRRGFVSLGVMAATCGILGVKEDPIKIGSCWESKIIDVDRDFTYKVIGKDTYGMPIVKVIKNNSHLGLPIGDEGPIQPGVLVTLFKEV